MFGNRTSRQRLCLAWLAVIITTSACTFGNPQIFEVTRIVPQTVVVTQVTERTITLTPESPTPLPPIQLGTINGNLCYPSEGIPPMTVYARNVDTQATYAIHVDRTHEYQIQVPAEAAYIVFAWSDAGVFTPDSRGGTYSCAGDFYGQMMYRGKLNVRLKCADTNKEDHTPLRVLVKPGEVTTDVYICDWGEQETVPQP